MAQSFRTAISFDGLASASSQAISIKVDGDSQNRVLIDAGGKITWGAGGSSAGDTTLYRNAANVLKTDDGFVAASVTVPDGGLTLGSTAVTSTASELNLVDGITAGTISASKAVIADSNKDVTGFRNVTLTGILDAINIKVNGAQGSDGQVLTSTGSGVAWEDASGGGGTPGGSNTQIQFNNSGNFGGNANLVYDGSSLITMTKSGANTGIKLDVASDTEAHSGNIAFYKSEAAGAGRLDKDAVYGQLDFYGQTASNGYHHAAAIKTLVGEYFYSDNYTPSDIEFWVTPSDQTSPVRKVVVRGGTANTDAAALEIWHNQANKGSRVDFVDDDGTQLGYFGFSANANWYMKNVTSGNMFIESEGSISIKAEGNYEVNFSSTGLEPYADEGYKLGSSSKEWSEAYIVDLKVSGNSTMTGTLTVGVDDTGHDVKFFGATSGKYMLWDESADALIVKDTVDAVNFKVNGGQGSDGQVLTSTGSGVAWEDASGGGTPGGSNTQIQFNNSGSFGGSSNLTFDGTNLTLAGDATIGDTLILTGDAVSHISNSTSSGREILQLRGKTANSDGAGINLYGDGDSSNAGKIIFFSGNSVSLSLDASGNLTESGNFQLNGTQTIGNDSTEYLNFKTGAAGTEGLIRWTFNTDDTFYATMGITYDDRASHGFYLDSAYPITLDGTTNINFEIAGTKYGYLEADGDWYFGTSTQQVRVDYDSSDKLKLVGDTGSDRPYISIWNRDASGNLDRKGYIGYPHAASDASRIYVRADQGYLDIGGSPGVYVNGSMYINSTVGPILGSGSGDTLRITNDHGYIDIGPMNDGAEHIYASASTLWLGSSGSARLAITSSSVYPNGNGTIDLGKSGKPWEHLWLAQANTFSSGGYYTLRSRDSDRQVMELVSSERFKKDIVDLTVSEAYQVLDSRVIKYRGVDDDSSVPLEVGLSAESLHNAGYEYAVRYDEGHWGETPRAVYYEYLTAPLIKICQDQKDRIESLEAKVAALEAA